MKGYFSSLSGLDGITGTKYALLPETVKQKGKVRETVLFKTLNLKRWRSVTPERWREERERTPASYHPSLWPGWSLQAVIPVRGLRRTPTDSVSWGVGIGAGRHMSKSPRQLVWKIGNCRKDTFTQTEEL